MGQPKNNLVMRVDETLIGKYKKNPPPLPRRKMSRDLFYTQKLEGDAKTSMRKDLFSLSFAERIHLVSPRF